MDIRVPVSALLTAFLAVSPLCAQSGPTVTQLQFASELKPDGTPADAGTQFTVSKLATVYALVEYSGFPKGLVLVETWSRGGETVKKRGFVWNGWEQGVYTAAFERPEAGFTTGVYIFSLSADDKPLITKEFTIQRERRFYPGIAIPLRGKIVDADTGKPVKGATVGILEPGALFEAWRNDSSYLLTGALSDAAGNFHIPVNLPRGLSYGIFVEALGYEPIYSELGLQIAANQVTPLIITIRIKRIEF